MCGRYQLDEESEGYQNFLKMVEEKQMLVSDKPYQTKEVCPGGNCLILCKDEKIHTDVKLWGTKLNNKLVINARNENLNNSKFYQDFKQNKCVIIANGYYEWDQKKEKHYFSYNPHGLIYMAGIYKQDEFVILTEESTRHHDIHHRQPILFTPQEVIDYLKA